MVGVPEEMGAKRNDVSENDGERRKKKREREKICKFEWVEMMKMIVCEIDDYNI